MIRPAGPAIVLAALLATAGWAAEWSRYENARFGYAIDIPPGFPEIAEADNGDGGVAQTGPGGAVLAVWGTILTELTLKEDVNQRIASEREEGWLPGYSGGTDAGYSWTATRGVRIMYARAVPLCEDEVAYFRLEYPATARTAFDPVVERLVAGFGSFEGCE